MNLRLISATAVLVAAALGSACSDDGKPCDPDQIYKGRICVPKPPDKPDAEPDVGDPVDGETSDAAMETAPPPGMFGKACSMLGDSPECTLPAAFCALQPGMASGYCTASGCKDDPSVCPVGWSCFSISTYNFCLRP